MEGLDVVIERSEDLVTPHFEDPYVPCLTTPVPCQVTHDPLTVDAF